MVKPLKELSPSTLCLSALRGWRREWRRRTWQAGATWRGGAHIQALHLAQPRPQRARARRQLSHLDHALAAKEARREVLAPAAVEEDAARPRLAYHHEAAVDRARLRRAAPPATARADGRRLARGKVGARVRVRVGLGLGLADPNPNLIGHDAPPELWQAQHLHRAARAAQGHLG